MAVVMTTEKRRPCLLGRHFIIKTDHYSLKYLMEQKITTVFQSKWLSKLMRYDYEVCYKKGKENVVADGLSRVPVAQLLAISTSSVHATLLEDVKQSWEHDSNIQEIISKLKRGENVPKYSYSQELLYRNGKLVVVEGAALHSQICNFFMLLLWGAFRSGCDY